MLTKLFFVTLAVLEDCRSICQTLKNHEKKKIKIKLHHFHLDIFIYFLVDGDDSLQRWG